MTGKEIILNKNITEIEVERMFGGDEEIIKYTAKKALPIMKKIPILKYVVPILGVMKDWSLMKRKIAEYEEKFNRFSDEIEELNNKGELNYNFIKTEEFVNNTLYLTEGIERSYDENQIDNLRKAYINLLKEENAEINLKSKYMEIASKITPFHISILNEIVDIFNNLYGKEDKIKVRNKGVTIQGASRKLLENTKLSISDISYLIRDLEKYNLITTENGDGSQYKGILKQEELVIKGEIGINGDEIIKELQIKGFLDNDFYITDKFSNLCKEQKIDEFLLDEKFNLIKNDLYNLLFQRNINYQNLQNSKVDEFIDKTLIAKPTGFGIQFLEIITKDPIIK